MGRNLSSKLREMMKGIYMHWCPGCQTRHTIAVDKPNTYNGLQWSWNGNAEKPTFTPGIIITDRCYYTITDGMIIYDSRSIHKYSGQTLELPDFPDWSKRKEDPDRIEK